MCAVLNNLSYENQMALVTGLKFPYFVEISIFVF